MKIIKQVAVILLICLFSEGISMVLPLEIPGSVIAIILTAVLLVLRFLKEKQIKETADFLLANMAIVFLPISVEILEELDILKGRLLVFFAVALISLLCTFFSSYGAVILVKKLLKKGKGGEEHERDMV